MYSIQHYVIMFVSNLRQVGRFSLGTLISFTNKTDLHDVSEILLEVELNTINLTKLVLLWCHYYSFHVGSDCLEAGAFEAAIRQARGTFDIGLDIGIHMDLLDIGGGIPGQEIENFSFEEVCSCYTWNFVNWKTNWYLDVVQVYAPVRIFSLTDLSKYYFYPKVWISFFKTILAGYSENESLIDIIFRWLNHFFRRQPASLWVLIVLLFSSICSFNHITQNVWRGFSRKRNDTSKVFPFNVPFNE